MSISEVVRGLEQPRQYTDLMIDLETLGLTANSVILSIGAALFDIETKDMGPTFYRNIDKGSCVALGMEVMGSTVAWWEKQSVEAKEGLLYPTPLPAHDAMQQFCDWTKEHSALKELRVWSHGAAFDIPLICTLAHKTGNLVPWSYQNEHDTRTLVLIAEKRGRKTSKPRIQSGTPHHALFDAIAQAKWMQNIWETLNG
jgi:exodeoxyribonuclease VIII